MGLAGAALAAALAVPAHAAVPGSAAACVGPAPVMTAHADARHVVVLATATADTVAAGWGDVNLEQGVRRPRRWRDMPVYGQVSQAARVAGPGAHALAPGPVVLVPWHAGCGGTYRWYRGFAWLRAGATDAVVGRLRRVEDWVDGVATIDVLRPELAKESGELRGAVRWTVTPEELFGFYATLPTRQQLDADPWRAIEPMRAWMETNPALVRRDPIRYSVKSVGHAAAHASVQAAPSPLAGTYRVEVSRTGGPTHVAYVRTELVPHNALFASDTLIPPLPVAAEGYVLRTSSRRGASQLPSPRPRPLTRLWRRITGTPPGDRMEVWLPAEEATDGSRRFRGHLSLWSSAWSLFPDDPELRSWIGEWSRRETDNMHVRNPAGEIVLRPDGSVEWTQVMELAPGQAVTMRATRISGVAYDRSPDW